MKGWFTDDEVSRIILNDIQRISLYKCMSDIYPVLHELEKLVHTCHKIIIVYQFIISYITKFPLANISIFFFFFLQIFIFQ
jgi:hypothetical protein